MITVLLYGHLRRQFGKFHRFDIRTPAEAIAALSANFPGFREYVLRHSEPGYKVVVGRECRDETTLTHPADDVIRIVPVVAGASDGWGKTIIGAILIVVGAFFEQGWMVKIGAALVLGGVAQLLAGTPKQNSTTDADNLPSYGFNGALNTTAQGNPVQWFYGEGIVGSQVISVGIDTEQIA